MNRFWDSSALLATVLPEPDLMRARDLLSATTSLSFWWGTPVEIAHAIGRRRREDFLTDEEAREVTSRLNALLARGSEVEASAEVRRLAIVVARTGEVRSADAFQLAAAIEAERRFGLDAFVTFDHRLADAARVRGLDVLTQVP